MGSQECAKFVKWVFLFFTFGFLLLGLLGLGFGIWGRIQVTTNVAEKDWYPRLPDKGLLSSMSLIFSCLTFVSVVLVVISFLGYCGALRENRCLLVVFFVLVFVVTFVIIAALLVLGTFESTLKFGVKTMLERQKNNYNDNAEDKTAVDLLQSSTPCCLWSKEGALQKNITSCFANKDLKIYNDKSCVDIIVSFIKEFMKDKQMTFYGITVIVVMVCIFSLALSLYIICKLKSESKAYNNLQ